MKDLLKDEVIVMAIKAGLDQEFWLAESHPNYDNEMRMLTTFATICRADLVAENERLKQKMFDESAAMVGIVQVKYPQVLAERDALKAACQAFSDYVHAEQCTTDGAVTYSTSTINHHAFAMRQALAAMKRGEA